MSCLLPWSGIALKIKGLAKNPARGPASEEAQLYYRRACLAAAEERYDVAFIFCGKALEVDALHLATRLLVARIHDRGVHDVAAAVAAYRKVIALAGYEGGNPFCAAARDALNALVQAEFEGAATAERGMAKWTAETVPARETAGWRRGGGPACVTADAATSRGTSAAVQEP